MVGTHSVATSHLDKRHNKEQHLPLPPWFQENPLGAPADAPIDEDARRIVVPLAGMPAGSCMINWTAIIHRRTDNNTDSPRRTFWQVFCREGFDLGGRLCGHLSAKYRAAQTIPGMFCVSALCWRSAVSSKFECVSDVTARIALLDDSAQRAVGQVGLLVRSALKTLAMDQPHPALIRSFVGAGSLASRGYQRGPSNVALPRGLSDPTCQESSRIVMLRLAS